MPTPQEVAQTLKRIARQIPKELREAEKVTLAEAHSRAFSYSSGPYSSASLRRMGHPYAHRAPNPPMPAGIINKQSVRFRGSWRRKLGSWSGGTLTSTLSNNSPEARYMRGTKFMIERPITALVVKMIRPIREKNLRAALRKALQP